ncbi:MAG: alpha/beta hydrolase fold domain-containing protein [Phycisphaerales bacterium]
MNRVMWLLSCVVVPLSACREQMPPRAQPSAEAPRHPVEGPARQVLDITFARLPDRTLELDLYLPPGASPAHPVPVILWFHGGGWVSGSRKNCPARFLVDHGFAVASVSYRMSFEAPFPAQIHDGKAAVRFLRSRAVEFGLDADRIGVFGQSAGGHMAALLATSGGVPDLEGTHGLSGVSSAVQACCNFCGLIDLTTVGRPDGVQGLAGTDSADSVESRFIGGPVRRRPEACRVANPTTYLDATDPPCLSLHGTADPLVPISQSRTFHQALLDRGVDSTFVAVPGGGHEFGGPEIEATVARFFRRVLRD